MLMQVKMLLLNIGILSDYFERETQPITYMLKMDKKSSRIFYDEVGFRFDRKQKNKNMLNDSETRDSHNVIPFSKDILKEEYSNEMRKLGIFKGYKKSHHFSRDVLLRVDNKLRSLKNDKINKFLDDNVSNNIKWFPIKNITKSKNEVYDFSLNDVENDDWCHSVLYNGFVGHQTPLGMNHFYNFWIGATRQDGNANSFYPISVNWREIPGRDDKFKKKIIKDIGLQRWMQEYETRFLGANSTLIDPDILERIVYKFPKLTKWTGLFLVYEEPVPGAQYVIGVDTGKGGGRDYSVIQVLKINSMINIEQVALYRNNQIIPHDFSQVCVSVAKYYNDAHMMIENNDIGQAVCDTVWYELEYENLINMDETTLGIRSTKRSKKIANMYLKEYMEKNWLQVWDEKTVYELSRYEEIKPGVYAAGRHEHDDTITALLWALYFVKTDQFDGEVADFSQIEEKYDVNSGGWGEDEEININTNATVEKEKRDVSWEPSFIMDD
jgi:hypothetical protein